MLFLIGRTEMWELLCSSRYPSAVVFSGCLAVSLERVQMKD